MTQAHVTTSASPLLAQAQSIYHGTLGNVLHLSADMFALIGLLAVLTAYIVWRGKDEGVTNLLALMIAGFALASLPFATVLGSLSGSSLVGAKAGALLVIFLIARFSIGTVVATVYSASKLTSWGSAVVLALLSTALLVVYAAAYLDIGVVYTLSPQILALALCPYALTSLIAASLVAVWFLNRR